MHSGLHVRCVWRRVALAFAPTPRLVSAAPGATAGCPPLPDAELLAAIQELIADLPTYGYRRVHALLRRQAEAN